MSRLKFSNAFLPQIGYLESIHAKVVADGSSGELVLMLAKKGIDLAADIALSLTAIANDKSFQAYTKSSQGYSQQRNGLMKPLIKHLAGSYQFIKTLNDPDFKVVGDWGGTISNSGKITIKSAFPDRVILIQNLKTKNDSYIAPIVSPLAPYLTKQNINLVNDLADTVTAKAKDVLFAADKSSAESFRQKRDVGWKPLMKHVRIIGNFLMVLHAGDEKALGAYGLPVVNTPPVIKTRNIKIYLGSGKLNVKVKIGSIISNIGTEPLNIYKGATITGTPMLLAVGAKWMVIKGYGHISIQNSSAAKEGLIQVLPKS